MLENSERKPNERYNFHPMRSSLQPTLRAGLLLTLLLASTIVSRGTRQIQSLFVKPGGSLPNASLAAIIKATREPFTTIIDLRAASAYSYAHVPRSRNIPVKSLLRWTDTLRKAQYILLYGEDDSDGATFRAAELLTEEGMLPKTSVYIGGWSEWSACHLPVESGNEKAAR